MERQSIDNEIDLVEQMRLVWQCRKMVLYVTLVFFAIGCLLAVLLPKEYKAWCEVVPQTSSATTSSRISSLAALAGISLAHAEEENTLSPYIYENIFSSAAFRIELLQTTLYSMRDGGTVTLFDYLLSNRGFQSEDVLPRDSIFHIEAISAADYVCLRELESRLMLTMDDKRGYFTISALMPEPLLAAQVVQAALEQLERYIIRLRIEKVQSNLDFVQQRYDEAFRHFEDLQQRRAKFRDANRNTTRYSAQTYLEQLDAEYSLAMNIYSELAMQLEQAKIKVKESMPVLTIVSPVMIPFRKDKPRRMVIIVVFTAVGLCVGAVLVLILPTIAEIIGCSSLLRLLPREAISQQTKCYAAEP